MGLGLLAGVTVLFSAGRAWVALQVQVPGLPSSGVSVTGSDVLPLVSALGAVILAGAVATVATRRLSRRLCGVVVAVAGICVVVASLRAEPALAALVHDRVVGAAGAAPATAPEGTASPWRWLCVGGGALAALAGGLVVWRGPSWPAMGARYDAPAARLPNAEPAVESDLWRALDRGDDPTERPSD